ncbi:MAG: 1-(5-phosphoribosyl)-5-[(5-phosphoribosylamino)methylideneamino]imidazole-4-carboxamide isomerase [Actinomycetota bacterium]|nr:1-(5-phosphoribosyl)-5-[(5-phosphoribosylamino)methylideneamino]imidazole-4-carboxamide isomerase [Actinomycetota bacterium]
MILYPAIDILGGKAVRLLQGEYDQETHYDDDPADAARRWEAGGAEYIHVVDLDGAKAGSPANLDVIERIAGAVACPIEVGGGLRDEEAVRAVLEAGAARVVVGTAALRDPEFLDRLIAEHGAAGVVVSVDARGGKVSLAGWTESSGIDVADAVRDMSGRGVERFLFTPIEVDGTMEGPNLPELHRVAAATSASVIASGGVGELEHLVTLAEEAPPNVEGVIVGRALYEGKFTVPEAIEALGGKRS